MTYRLALIAAIVVGTLASALSIAVGVHPAIGDTYPRVYIPACQEDEVITRRGKCINRDEADFSGGYWRRDR